MLRTTIQSFNDHSDYNALLRKDPMKVWQEMKQNGFLTPSVAQMHPTQAKKSKKRENCNYNRKRAFTKMQEPRNVNGTVAPDPEVMPSNGLIPMQKQLSKKCRIGMSMAKKTVEKVQEIDRFDKIGAPSGLLNELNPGIINRMRNSEQVFGVLNALLRRDEIIDDVQKAADGCKGKSDEENDTNECLNSLSCSSQSQVETFPGTEMELEQEQKIINLGVSKINVEHEDEEDDARLSLTPNMKSESICSSISNEKSANTASASSLYQEGPVPSQWLQFLHQDVSNRLAALKRSQTRVQNVIKTELPSLLAKEFSTNQQKAIMEMHQAKWNPLFLHMDNALQEEANQLEQWLNQVIEMPLQANDSLHFFHS